MKLSEIIERKNKGENLSDLVAIKPYIPLILKRSMVKSITGYSLTYDENGIVSSDAIMQELFTVLNIVLEVADIEIDGLFDEIEKEDGIIHYEINLGVALEAYDTLMQSGIYKYIDENLASNCKDISSLVDLEIANHISVNNSVGAVLTRALQTIINMIPSEQKIGEMMSSLPVMLDGLKNNPDLMKTIQTVLPDMNRAQKRSKKKTGDV
jgi:hypothetical protein